MKRVRLILLAVVAGAIIALIVAVVWPREREPEYQGRSLSEWVEKCSPTNYAESRIVLKKIGTNALPWLVKWLSYEPSGMRIHLQRILGKVPNKGLQEKLREGERYSAHALWSLRALGSDSKGVAPDLARTLNNAQWRGNRRLIVFALTTMDEDGLSSLIDVVEHRGPASWDSAKGIEQMHSMGIDVSKAMPTLLVFTAERRERPGLNSFYEDLSSGLPGLHRDLASHVNTIGKCLRNPDSRVRVEAARTLGVYPDCVQKVPPVVAELVTALNDPDLKVRTAVTNALRNISPEFLADGKK